MPGVTGIPIHCKQCGGRNTYSRSPDRDVYVIYRDGTRKVLMYGWTCKCGCKIAVTMAKINKGGKENGNGIGAEKISQG